MTQIIIPEKKDMIVVPRRELEIEEGDLIMYFVYQNFSSAGKLNSGMLGVFEGLFDKPKSKYRQYSREAMKLKNVYTLRQSKVFGKIEIPIITYYCEESSCLLTNIKEAYAGQEQIVRKLRDIPELKVHAEWIERLQKPY